MTTTPPPARPEAAEEAPPPDDAPPALHSAMVLRFYGGALALAVGLSALGEGGVARLWRPTATPWPVALAESLAFAAALLLGSWLGERYWPAMRRLTAELQTVIGPIDTRQALLWGLCSGVAEEALFRGPVQDLLGWLATAIGFGLLHGGLSRRLIAWSCFALVAGAGFGLLTERHDSVWPAALAHIVVNAVNLRRLGARSSSEGRESAR